MALNLESILSSVKVSENLARAGRNFIKIGNQIEDLFNSAYAYKEYNATQYTNDKWYRLWLNDTVSSGNINEILQVTIGSATGNLPANFILSLNSVHQYFSICLLSATKMPVSIGVTKVRSVHPTTAWTYGRYVDLYITGLVNTIEITCKKISVMKNNHRWTGIFAETLQEAPAIPETHTSTEVSITTIPSGKAVIDTQPAWITATLQNGWTAFDVGGLQYTKNDLGMVTIKFSCTAGTITNRTIIANLPVGYRPYSSTAVVFDLLKNLDGYVSGEKVFIQSNGNIYVANGTALVGGQTYLGQVSFYAGN